MIEVTNLMILKLFLANHLLRTLIRLEHSSVMLPQLMSLPRLLPDNLPTIFTDSVLRVLLCLNLHVCNKIDIVNELQICAVEC